MSVNGRIAFFNSFENAIDTKKCVIRWLAKNNKRQDRKPNCFIHPIVLFGQKGLPQKDSVCQHRLFFSLAKTSRNHHQ